jgi:hypothetical protein
VTRVEADGDMLHVTYEVDAEQPVTLRLSLSPSDARTVARWPGSLARLYLGHEYGPAIQRALRKTLADLE